MGEEYQLELNSNEICRNCLAKNCQLKSLFRCDIIDGEIWPIPKVYKSVTDISISENDNFPQNICTKCESSMFEAFTFKQKSAKSHNLLRKILKQPEENKIDVAVIPIPNARTSQSTQTQNIEEKTEDVVEEEEEGEEGQEEEEGTEETIFELNDDEVYMNEIKPMVEEEFIEDEENVDVDDCEMSETWQTVYLTNADNEYSLSDSDEKPCEIIEIEGETKDIRLARESKECYHCGELIPPSQFNKHIKQHARLIQSILTAGEFFRCNRCLKVYPDMETFTEHTNAKEPCQSSDEIRKDDSCIDYQYLGNDPPIRMFSTSKCNVSSLYSCSLCEMRFEDVLAFSIHSEENHFSNSESSSEYMRAESSHSCGICDKLFSNLQDALHHVYFHQIGYPCPHNECWELSDSFATLYIHFVQCHKDDDVECSHCTFMAANNLELRQHQRNSCTARRFKCDICGKTFYKKSTLNMHIRTHTNERRYACDLCPKAFLQSNDLANHVRTHTLERPFKCDLCDKSFKTIGQRIGHMSTHVTQKNFECDICKKTFKSARILRGHKKIHGERQFQCQKCDKKFNRNYHLTLHMKRHESPKIRISKRN